MNCACAQCSRDNVACVQVRAQIRKIFTNMGFEEMPTNNYVESSFWNFDALFQPQQHPARDAHDTFFLISGCLDLLSVVGLVLSQGFPDCCMYPAKPVILLSKALGRTFAGLTDLVVRLRSEVSVWCRACSIFTVSAAAGLCSEGEGYT